MSIISQDARTYIVTIRFIIGNRKVELENIFHSSQFMLFSVFLFLQNIFTVPIMTLLQIANLFKVCRNISILGLKIRRTSSPKIIQFVTSIQFHL